MRALTLGFFVACVSAAGQGSAIYFQDTDPCPVSCEDAGPRPDKWTAYNSLERLGFCNGTLVVSFAVFSPLDDPDTGNTLRTCTLSQTLFNSTSTVPPSNSPIPSESPLSQRSVANQTSPSTEVPKQGPAQLKVAWSSSSPQADKDQVISAAEQLETFIDSTFSLEGPVVLFLYEPISATSLGVYAGTGVSLVPVFDSFSSFIASNNYPGDVLVQACSEPVGTTLAEAGALGLVVSTGPYSLVTAQRVVRDWANSTCTSQNYENTTTLPVKLQATSIIPRRLGKRAICRTVDVQGGDLCAPLAARCGISMANLLRFNPQANFCNTLKVPQKVCCSAGDLPIPRPDANGNCASYEVGAGDSCWAIATANLITVADLEKYNKNTWGWAGCSNLQASSVICLSSGEPPMPIPFENAICGPLKPGTPRPPAGTSLASLNPCKLNACCNVWGQCGTTSEFCIKLPSDVAPGAPQGPNGPNCISNCGMDIVNNAVAPPSFFRIGYFEGYGTARACHRVDIRTIDTSRYSHIHFSFATVTPDTFEVDMGPTIHQFHYFKQLTGVKKIIAFGGWSFSTEPATYAIFRNGVLPQNRQRMARNIADFVVQNNLDGVDIDWEYPAAPDIPGIPAGDEVEGINYLRFMTVLKSLLPPGKTLSFAAPASYWYLKGFPMDRIIKEVDYVVYMTYDLHGQWDYDNKWSSPGCPAGNCLRSHVNMTETLNALSMVTKAGVPANKIVVGVSSYGRSFRMTTPGCTGEMCTFTGPASGATPGKCTGTAGYISNAEIRDIIQNNPSARQLRDASGQSNILVYDSVQWVAYMDDATKEFRANRYRRLNFLGISDWAISLDDTYLVPPKEGSVIDDDDTFPTPQFAVVPQLHESCEPWKDILLEGWKEAGLLAKAGLHWSSRWSKYQKALDFYIGKQSGKVPWVGRDVIWDNIKKHHAIHYGGKHSPNFLYLHWYCDKTQLPDKIGPGFRPRCRYDPDTRKGTRATTWRFPGMLYSEYYTLWCPLWLGNQRGAPVLRSLENYAREGDGYKEIQNKIDGWKSVRALTMHHEVNHFQDVSDPHCDGLEIYEPHDIASWAQNMGNNGYETMLRNAHSWTLAMTSMFMMDRYKMSEPPKPNKPIPAKPPPLDDKSPDDEVWYEELDPPGFDPSKVDPRQFKPLSRYGSIVQDSSLPCYSGTYDYEDQCELLCGGHACSKTSDSKFRCSDCTEETNECKAGAYSSFNECSANCNQGMCSESAGQPDVTCSC